jgi:hypothetical protein
VTSADSSSLRWIDSVLEFPVKLLAADGTTIARKLDPRALIERIKHSDAWVDP